MFVQASSASSNLPIGRLRALTVKLSTAPVRRAPGHPCPRLRWELPSPPPAVSGVSMFLRRVVLQHIKGFEYANLDLSPDGDADHYCGWAVITGDNGSGKTALLRAISLALLGPEQSRGLVPDLRGWVTEGKQRGTISVEVRPDHDHDRTAKGGYPVQGTFWAEVEVVSDGTTWNVVPADVYRQKKEGAANGPWSLSTPGWFALGYGPFRRLYGSSPDAQRLMVIPGRIPRFATLFKEDATLGEAEEWLKELHFKTPRAQ
jgi:hypothetical protein